MSGIPEQLKIVWTLKPGEKVSQKDFAAIHPKLSLQYFFQTHLMPQPWWGNIEDPDIIFLALNPSYDPVIDDEDELAIESDLKENLVSKSFNWFQHKEIIDSGNKKRKTSGYQWWKATLGDLYKQDDLNTEMKIYHKIGFFQLCGYHSKSYFKLTRKCLLGKKNLLPTQETIVEYINELIKKRDRYIVLIWGEKHWKNANLDFKTSKLVKLKGDLDMNHYFKSDLKEYEQIIKEIKDLMKNESPTRTDL